MYASGFCFESGTFYMLMMILINDNCCSISNHNGDLGDFDEDYDENDDDDDDDDVDLVNPVGASQPLQCLSCS